MDILAVEKPKIIKLADGKEYTLPIVNMTTLANIEKTMGCGGKALTEKMNTEPMNTLRLYAYAILKENYPTLSIEETGKLITLTELKEFSEIVTIMMAIG
jgi:hypothetical protein